MKTATKETKVTYWPEQTYGTENGWVVMSDEGEQTEPMSEQTATELAEGWNRLG